MTEGKKKSFFDKAIDALTDRDEKEAEAVNREAAARSKLAAEEAAADRAARQKAAALRAAADRSVVQKPASEKAAVAPRKGVVTVRSLRIRADHSTKSDVVGGLVEGDQVTILGTWSDGRNTWVRLDKGWAAMLYNGETYIKLV